MRIRPLRLVLLVFCTCISTSAMWAQQRSSKTERSAKIVATRPGVSLGYLRSEVGSLGDDPGHHFAWLRMENNMRFPIRFCIYDGSVSPNGQRGPLYEIERVPNYYNVESRDSSGVPIGMVADQCREYVLSAGKRFDFAIVTDKVARDTRLKVSFFFPWEESFAARTGREPQHSVYFYFRDLP